MNEEWLLVAAIGGIVAEPLQMTRNTAHTSLSFCVPSAPSYFPLPLKSTNGSSASRTPLSFLSTNGSPTLSKSFTPGTAATSVATPSRGLCVTPVESTQHGSPVHDDPNGSFRQLVGQTSCSLQFAVLVGSHGITSFGGGSSGRTV